MRFAIGVVTAASGAVISSIDFRGTITLGSALILIFAAIVGGYYATKNRNTVGALDAAMSELSVLQDRCKRLEDENQSLREQVARLTALTDLTVVQKALEDARHERELLSRDVASVLRIVEGQGSSASP